MARCVGVSSCPVTCLESGHAILTNAMQAGVMQPDGSLVVEPTMDVSAVGSALVYMSSLPLDANVMFMTVMATSMPYIGRG